MKLRTNPNSTHPLISKHEVIHKSEITRELYDHPWHRHVRNIEANTLNKPNPPTKEAIERAKFVDKTYHWGRDDSVRPRKQRVTK